MTSPRRLRVAILDDHPPIIDGYRFRLSQAADIEIVGTAGYGEALAPLLNAHPADVLLLDLGIPTSAENRNPYPILTVLPRLLAAHPALAVIVITMYAESSLIKAVMKAGASGYLLKDDPDNLQRLDEIVRGAADGDICLSAQAYALWKQRNTDALEPVTQRQLEVLSLSAAYPDASTHELAARMNIASSTLRNLLSNAYLRLGVNTRAGAVAEARRRGLITPYPPAAP